MNSSVTERLTIDNFLSIKHFDWEIKDFNVLTGGMASGKSICVKLVHFAEQIMHKNIFFASITKDSLTRENFYSNVAQQFDAVFHSNHPQTDFHNTEIVYTFTLAKENMVFDLNANWNEHMQKLEWQSNYIDARIDNWREFLGERNTPDAAQNARLRIHENIAHDFSGHFPITATFIPASRAALAFGFGSSFDDGYLRDYNGLINLLKSFPSRKLKLNSILKANIKEIDGGLWLESEDGRNIPISKASSGQQEIIYVLMLLDKLGNFQYSYGKDQSLFIEEPSAHLFPQEQKQTIELIVDIFNRLKEEGKHVRFFITTHSPYILNSLNNILKKGSLLEKYSGREHEINSEVKIPRLSSKEISACFIDANGIGKSIFDINEKYIYDDDIANISFNIDEDARKLSELKNKFLDEGE
ncbi:MAG: ATP-binding protein [Spirochaetaceae bacterium]|jgi:predicted ATPase|nr:ATP-binding protein [Spirochaetaceae bacterium]